MVRHGPGMASEQIERIGSDTGHTRFAQPLQEPTFSGNQWLTGGHVCPRIELNVTPFGPREKEGVGTVLKKNPDQAALVATGRTKSSRSIEAATP